MKIQRGVIAGALAGLAVSAVIIFAPPPLVHAGANNPGQGPPGSKGDKGDTGSSGAAGANATTTAAATSSANGLMSASDKAKLDAFAISGGVSVAASILSLATQDVDVTLGKVMPNTTYAAVATVSGSGAILVGISVQGIKSQTTSTVTVTIKNISLSTITSGITVNVIAYTAL